MAVIDVALKAAAAVLALSLCQPSEEYQPAKARRRHNRSIQRSDRLNASRATVIYLPVMFQDCYSAESFAVMYTAEGQMARMLSSGEVLVLIVQRLTPDPPKLGTKRMTLKKKKKDWEITVCAQRTWSHFHDHNSQTAESLLESSQVCKQVGKKFRETRERRRPERCSGDGTAEDVLPGRLGARCGLTHQGFTDTTPLVIPPVCHHKHGCKTNIFYSLFKVDLHHVSSSFPPELTSESSPQLQPRHNFCGVQRAIQTPAARA